MKDCKVANSIRDDEDEFLGEFEAYSLADDQQQFILEDAPTTIDIAVASTEDEDLLFPPVLERRVSNEHVNRAASMDSIVQGI